MLYIFIYFWVFCVLCFFWFLRFVYFDDVKKRGLNRVRFACKTHSFRVRNAFAIYLAFDEYLLYIGGI